MRLRNSFLALVFLLGTAGVSLGAVPDWLRAVARDPLPNYPADTDGVVLLHEEVTSVDNNGEIHTLYREAVKILRANARKELARVLVNFDNETQITFLKGWSITANGQEYEVKEKDAIETNAAWSEFISDAKIKILSVPGAEVGSVIGYEYQQRRRPSIYEDIWSFQIDLPVRTTRYTLRLPPSWEYETSWSNHAKIEPTIAGNDITWEAKDVSAIEQEDEMPPWRAIAGRMLVHFFGPGGTGQGSTATWQRVGAWYGSLASDQRQPTPELQQQVKTLTANEKTTLDKIAALARWVQKEIRYVAVEIGIGGYQPHPAGDTFRARYGDCKDKVTLLATMLREIGVDSNYLLIHTSRGVVKQENPSAMTFNHVILAIHLPKDANADSLGPVYTHPTLGKLLLFDPTADMTPFGLLPATLQQTNALLITANGGEMIQMPLLDPKLNALERQGKLTLSSDGSLSGQVTENRTGAIGSTFRAELLHESLENRSKMIESMVGNNISTYQLTKAAVASLNDVNQPLVVRYDFVASNYAKKSGGLMLLRPRVVGQKNWTIMEGKKRLYPVEYESASYQTDTFEIDIPVDYEVDELPDPMDVSYDFGEYHSKFEQNGQTLKYSRQFTIKKVIIPTDRLDDLKKFYRQIASDEKGTAVLKPKVAAGK